MESTERERAEEKTVIGRRLQKAFLGMRTLHPSDLTFVFKDPGRRQAENFFDGKKFWCPRLEENSVRLFLFRRREIKERMSFGNSAEWTV